MASSGFFAVIRSVARWQGLGFAVDVDVGGEGDVVADPTPVAAV
jgi:hypothetical protein